MSDSQAVAATVLLGAAAIALGLVVYLTQRDLSRSSLIPSAWQLAAMRGRGNAVDWLPSFLHSLAFSLWTGAVLWPCRRRVLVAACVAWAAIDVLFELGQHPSLKLKLAARLVELTDASRGGLLLARYFAAGVFDPADVAAAVAGALCAALFLNAVFHLSKARHRHG